MLALLAVVIASILLLTAVVLMTLGLRGRVVDDHPYCRQCKFDLHQRWPDVAKCPECGCKLGEGTIRLGRRVRRRGRIITALAIFIFVFGLAFTTFSGTYTQLGPYKPLWLLRADLLFGGQSLASAAIIELAARLADQQVDAATMDTLARELLAIQADMTRPWLPSFGDVLEAARTNQLLGDELWTRYVEQGVPLPIITRPLVRENQPVPIRYDLSPVRLGSATYSVFISSPMVVEFGEPYEPPGGRIGSTLRTISGSGSSMTSTFAQSMPVGTHVQELAMQVSVDFAGIETSFIRRQLIELAVQPIDSQHVKLRTDNLMREAMSRSISVERMRVSRVASLHVQGMVNFDYLPIDAAFQVTLIDGDRRWRLPHGFVSAPRNTPHGHGLHSLLSDLEGDEPFDATRVDVLLEPSIQAAERTIEMLHIWGEPVLIKDIPITWED